MKPASEGVTLPSSAVAGCRRKGNWPRCRCQPARASEIFAAALLVHFVNADDGLQGDITAFDAVKFIL